VRKRRPRTRDQRDGDAAQQDQHQDGGGQGRAPEYPLAETLASRVARLDHDGSGLLHCFLNYFQRGAPFARIEFFQVVCTCLISAAGSGT